MPQLLSELKLNEVSLVDRPANSTVDPKTGKKTPRAVIALYKRDMEKDVVIASADTKGIQFVLGIPASGGSKVQSVMFDKDLWPENKARAWLTDHDMKAGSPDVTTNTLRFRQLDPGGFKEFRVIQPGKQKGSAEKSISIGKDVDIAGKHDYGPDDKEIFKAVFGDPDATVGKDGACQTQGGKCYPASDYAYVPDKTKPSTWKLRLTSEPGGAKDSGIVGAAAAALGPGFRGRKVQIPSAALAAVKAKVRAAWHAANEGKGSDEMPDALKKSQEGETMTVEETLEKMDGEITALKKRNADLDAENALVMKMTKGERKAYASMDDDTRKAFMAADTQKRGTMLTEAKRKRREKKLTDSMDDACKAEFAEAGPIKKAAMLEEQAVKLEKARRAKGSKDTESDQGDGDDGDDGDDGQDDGDDGDDGQDDGKQKRKKVAKADADSFELRKQLAASEDRVTKVEAELDSIRKRERTEHFVKMAELELPNTPGSPAEKGAILQKLADAFGEQSAEFKKQLADKKNADKILAAQYSEIGKAARGDIPTWNVLDAKIEEIAKRDKIDKPHAVEKAMLESPELFVEYEREQRGIATRA